MTRVEGDAVTIRPLAGTRKRGASPEEDKALAEELIGMSLLEVTDADEQIAEGLRAFHREGIDLINIYLNPMTSEGIERMAEALRVLRAA